MKQEKQQSTHNEQKQHLSLKPGTELKPSAKLLPKLYGRLELSDFLEMAERDFFHMAHGIEHDPLFLRFFFSERKEERIIHFKPFTRTGLTTNYLVFNEEMFSANYSPDVEHFLEKKKLFLHKVKEIGIENFKKYFLYGEANTKKEEIMKKCKINPEEIENIFSLVDDIFLLEHFWGSSIPAQARNFKLIARVDICGNGRKNRPVINYFLPFYARGKYIIDYKKLYSLTKEKRINDEDLKKARTLLKDLELINIRKSLLYIVTEKLVDIQAEYIKSMNENTLKPLTQKLFARSLRISESSVTRIIKDKFIQMPWGEEKLLKFFFFKRKSRIKNLIREIMNDAAQCRSSDEGISKILEEIHGIKVSRRTVCAYRKESSQ